MRLALRPLTTSDLPLLAAPALGETGAARPDPARGDVGLVCHRGGDVHGEILGAAWLQDRGGVLEAVVGVTAEAPERAVRRVLLQAVVSRARDTGAGALSLRVGPGDPVVGPGVARALGFTLARSGVDGVAPGALVASIRARAVLFDLDDTLLDHRTAASRAVTGFAADQGLPGPGAVGRWERLSALHYDRYQRRETTLVEHRRTRIREFLDRLDLRDADADGLFDDYQRRYRSGWAAFDDALPALQRARTAGLTVAVLTNGEQAMQTDKLRRTGLLEHVDLVLASSELPAAKPDRRAFTAAADRLDVAPTELVMVGDSIAHDVRGARAVGADAVLVDRRRRHHDVARAGIRRVTTLADLDWRPTTTAEPGR